MIVQHYQIILIILIQEKLLIPKNKCNTKDESKIKKLIVPEKILLKKRINIEYLINDYKQLKRCQLRYDKYMKTFKTFLFLAIL